MVSFAYNGSEVTTWMGYNFKTKSKSTKSQGTFLRKTSFSNFRHQSLDYQKDAGVARQLTKSFIFIAARMRKHI